MAITYYFENLSFILGTICAIAILIKDRKYLANKTLAIGLFLLGVYPMCIFIYDIINQYWAINLFLRIGMVSILFSSLLIYFTMQIIMKSAKSFRKNKSAIIYTLICIGISIYVSVADFIILQESHIGNVNISIGILPLTIMIVFLTYLTIINIIITWKYGIKNPPSNKKSQRKIKMFFYGLILMIPSLFINTLSHIVSDDLLGTIFDALTYLFISISLLFLAFSVLEVPQFIKKKSS